MGFSAVIFDLFGTLVSGRPWLAHDQVVLEMATLVGAPPEDFVHAFELVTRDDRERGLFPSLAANITYICDQLGVVTTPAHIERASQVRREFTRQALEPRPDTIDTLARLKEGGCRLGLISDCSPDVPPLWLETPMAELIEDPIFSSDVGIKKPDQRIYDLFIDRAGVHRGECLYVGDGGSSELTGAKRAGMVPVLLKIPEEQYVGLIRADATSWQGTTIGDLSEVLELIAAAS